MNNMIGGKIRRWEITSLGGQLKYPLGVLLVYLLVMYVVRCYELPFTTLSCFYDNFSFHASSSHDSAYASF